MGIEYYLVDNKEKKYFFLGKGNWGSGYGDSKLLTNLVSLEKTLEFVMETAFRGRGLEGEKLLAKMLFENFNSSDISDLELNSDDWYAPPRDYHELGDAYTVRGYGNKVWVSVGT